MNQEKLNRKTEKGIPLSAKEIKYLAKKWRLVTSASVFLMLFLLIAAVVTISIILLLSDMHYVVIYILVALLVIGGLSGVYLITRKRINLITDYLLSVDTYYGRRHDEFQGFDIAFTTHDFQRSGHLQNKLCLFITDGYSFYIADDYLIATDYFLPRAFANKKNKSPAFKVFDAQSINKRPVYFTLSEISSWEVARRYTQPQFKKESLAERVHPYTYFPLKEDVTNLCIIELEDNSIFKLGVDIYPIMRKHAPGKERQ